MKDLCEDHWWGNVTEYSLDFLPYLRIIWAKSNARCEITFTDSNPMAESISKIRPDTPTDDLRASARALNDNNQLDIKRFNNSSRLLGAVTIDYERDRITGCVSFLMDNIEWGFLIQRKAGVFDGNLQSAISSYGYLTTLNTQSTITCYLLSLRLLVTAKHGLPR